MAKLPSFSDLTDLKKLKDLGSSIANQASSLANQAKVGEFIDRVKSGVDTFTGSKTDPFDEEDKTPIKEQFVAISESLKQIMAHHKAQAQQIHQLNQQIKELYASLKTTSTTTEDEEDKHSEEEK